MTFQPQNFTVWAEIPVTDMDRAIAFYEAVCQTTLTKDNSGPNPMANFPFGEPGSVSGHLYPGKPAANGEGPTVHLAVPGKIEAAVERVKAAGGKVISEIITIPPGRFFYAQDLDGNSIGCFEVEK